MRQPGRVLITTWDGAGNLPPVLTLARALVEQGNDVHVLGHNSTRQRFEREGCTYHPLKNVLQPDFIRNGLPVDQEVRFATDNIFYEKGFLTNLHTTINKLSPDVVLVDMSLRYAILEGLSSDKPLVVLCHTLYSLMSGGNNKDSHFQELNEVALLAGLCPFESRKQMVESADQVLSFSYAPFDQLAGDEIGSNVLHVGPLRSFNSESFTWSRKYPGRNLVLIALSTSNQNQGALLQRLCDACENLDVEAFVTTGPTISPDTLDTPENVKAIQYIPHDKVLPNVDLLITHAGHGTVMAGVTYGVPMMCIPMGRDQPYIARRVDTLGLGTMLDVDTPIDALQRTILNMLNDTELRKRARDFSNSLQGHAGIGEAIEAIHKVMKKNE